MTHYHEPQEVIVAGLDSRQGEQTYTAGPVSYCSQPRDGGILWRLGVSETETKIKRLVKDREEDKKMKKTRGAE